MKILLLLFTVCSVQQLVWSDVAPDRKELYKYRPLRGPLQSNVKILNERKLQKKIVSKQLFFPKPVHTGKTKRVDKRNKNYTVFPAMRPNLDQSYTVFPPMSKDQQSVPESRYFEAFNNEESKKIRVKKVLPGLARVKRSADRHSKKHGHSDKKEESRRAVHEKDEDGEDVRRSHHKKPHKKHNKRHGKKHHNHKSRKHKKSGHRRSNDGKDLESQNSGNDVESSDQESSQESNQESSDGNDTRRLYGSRDADIEDYPYVVSIQKGDEHWCAGALLNPRIVITTANCVWKSTRLSRMYVRAGSRITNSGGQRARIHTVVKHPDWSIRRPPDNDVAMLLLDRNIKFSNKVHGADIPNRLMTPSFDDAWITSWGADRRDGIYNPDRTQLQVYHGRLMDRAKCNNQTRRFGITVTENFFCLSQAGRRSPCTRDTGAPAVSDGVIWGLASWGIRKLCGTERFPAMFSYLGSPSNHDFLINATRFLMSDMRDSPFLDHFPPRGPLRLPRTSSTQKVYRKKK